jgi:hypothetical protein
MKRTVLAMAVLLTRVLSVSAQQHNMDAQHSTFNDPRRQNGRVFRTGTRTRSARRFTPVHRTLARTLRLKFTCMHANCA